MAIDDDRDPCPRCGRGCPILIRPADDARGIAWTFTTSRWLAESRLTICESEAIIYGVYAVTPGQRAFPALCAALRAAGYAVSVDSATTCSMLKALHRGAFVKGNGDNCTETGMMVERWRMP
jgi:hypothetical protein